VTRNTSPAKNISTAPRISIFRRPPRSALVVIHNEMTVSPSSVKVSSQPTR
jgi:hypothetical protein